MKIRKVCFAMLAALAVTAVVLGGCGRASEPRLTMNAVVTALEDAGFEIGERASEKGGYMAEAMEEERAEFGAEDLDAVEVNGDQIVLCVFDPSAGGTPQNIQNLIETAREEGGLELKRHHNLLYDVGQHPDAAAIREIIEGL